MSGATDDLNNLGPGGVNDPGEAELRRRVNADVEDALANVNFRSRRSAIMAQIRNTASPDADAGTSITPLSKLEQTTLAASPLRPENPINGAADNVRSITQARTARPRNFFVSGWSGALAAAIVVLLVGGLALLLLNNSNNTAVSHLANAPAPAADKSGLTSAAATTVAATSMAAATTSAAAATTSAATFAATTSAASTTTSAAASGGNASGAATSAAAATTAAATTAAAATTVAAASAAQTASDQSNLPFTVVNNLPTYPGSDNLNLDNGAARAFVLRLLLAASGSVNQSLNNNGLVLLNVYKVKGADLPQWYADRLKDQNFKLTAQNNAEASTEPNSANLDWRVFTSTTDPKQSLTYFFLNVKNSTFINELLGPNKVADGDTIVLVFGSRRS